MEFGGAHNRLPIFIFFGVGRVATDRRAPIPINQTIRLQHLHFRPEKSKNHHLTSARLKLTALITKKDSNWPSLFSENNKAETCGPRDSNFLPCIVLIQAPYVSECRYRCENFPMNLLGTKFNPHTPVRQKLRMRWFFDVCKVKESSFF